MGDNCQDALKLRFHIWGRRMRHKLGHGAGDLLSQWGRTICAPWVRTVTSQYPSWYDLWCCWGVKLQHPKNLCESTLHIVGKAQYVEGVLLGVVGVEVRPSVHWRECLQGRTGINPGCSKTKQLGQDEAGEARKDKITGRDHNERKSISARERAPPGLAIRHNQWWGASPGFKKNKEWVN